MFPYQQVVSNPIIGTPTGQITVIIAGTIVQGPNIPNAGGFYLKALPANTNTVWVFGAGQTKVTGFPLAAGDVVVMSVTSLQQLWFDAEVSGEKIAWAEA